MLVIYFVATLFHDKSNFLLTLISLVVLAFIYSAQLIYFCFFKSFFSIYSVGKTNILVDFWSDIGLFLLKNAHWILLIFLPVIILIILGRVFFSLKQSTPTIKFTLVIAVIATFFLGKFVIYLNGKGQHSTYTFTIKVVIRYYLFND